MSKFEEIRGTVETKLEQMKAQLSAFERQLRLERDQAVEQLEARKRRVEKEARELRSLVEEWPRVTSSTKADLQASFEQLRLQLALGATESRDALDEQRRKLDDAISSFETKLDHAVEEAAARAVPALEGVQRDFVRAADSLRAEQEVLLLRLEHEGGRAKAEFEKRGHEVVAQIEAVRKNMEAKREQASVKLSEFTEELSSGVSRVREAFSKLLK